MDTVYIKICAISEEDRENVASRLELIAEKIRAGCCLDELFGENVADAASSANNAPLQRLGVVAQASLGRPSARYVPRKSGKASVFLREHWGHWLAQNALHQHELAELDPALKCALDNEFKGRRSELRSLLPTKQDEVNRRLELAAGGPIRPEARAMAVRGLGMIEAAKRRP